MSDDVLRGYRGREAVELWMRFLPENKSAKLIELAMSLGSAGVSLSSSVIAGR